MSTVMPGPLKVFNQSFSCKSPLVLPVDLDFTSSNSYTLELQQYVDLGYIDYISSVYFDLSQATYDITLQSNICKQKLYLPHGYVGYMPIFLGANPAINCTVSTAINSIQQIFVSNIPFFPFLQKVQ